MNFLRKYGYLFLLTFSVGDFLIPYILAFFYPNYRPFHQVISDLGEAGSPVELVFRYSAIITGTLLLLSLPAVYERYQNISLLKAKLLVIALASFGIGQCILTGLFSVDRGSSEFNISMFIHEAGSFLGTIGMLLAPLFLWGLHRGNNDSKAKTVYLSLFWLSCVFSLVNGLSQLVDFQFEGLWQRLSLLCLYLPTVYLGLSMKLKSESESF